MTNTAIPAKLWSSPSALPFGSVLVGREHLGMFLQTQPVPSREVAGYWVPQIGLLFSNGWLVLPLDSLVEVGSPEAVFGPPPFGPPPF